MHITLCVTGSKMIHGCFMVMYKYSGKAINQPRLF